MRPMPELKVVEIPTDELVEYENNAKLHPHEQVDQIASSIEEFGFNSPILAWHNDDDEPEIIAGHGRLMAARKLGMEKLPVVFLDHMTEEQRRAYILVDNKLTMNSDFDLEILADEIAALDSFDMSEYGFEIEAGEIDEVLDEEEMEPELEITRSLDFASNYVVLKFDTDVDWLYAQEVLGIKKVMTLSTRVDGKDNVMTVAGVGRVLDGIETIERLVGGRNEN